MSPPASKRKEKPYEQFVNGALGAMAGSAASHPLDVAKVRLQINQELRNLSMVRVLGEIYRRDGIARGLFRGLSSSLARQCVYSGIRFGVYDIVKGKGEASLGRKVGSGLFAGGVGAFIANPIDVVLVRSQADGKYPPEQRRNYKNVADGLIRVAREEGVTTLWRGCEATVARAMVITASQFAVYDTAKEIILEKRLIAQDGPPVHLLSAFTAGFVASVTSNPFDCVKTRMMNATKGTYTGTWDCAVRLLRESGPLGFYKGFTPTFVRQAPYVIVMFLTMEQSKKFFNYVNAIPAA